MVFLALKNLARRLFRVRDRRLAGARLSYWKERARVHGRMAALNLGHRDQEFETVTLQQVREIFPYFLQCLRGNESFVLDFGCGPGRFTTRLAEATHGRALGIDPVPHLISLAPQAPAVEYMTFDGENIPLADQSVDVAWICLVLGGLTDPEVSGIVAELKRVVRPDGLIFLVENTTEKESASHWAFRSVQEYQRFFSFTPLDHLHDYYDLGERISIMAGRKK